MKNALNTFWEWYERTYVLNVSIALGLFLFQITHLVWLFGEVVWSFVFGTPLFTLSAPHQFFIVLVDYIEIPTIISVSFVYIHALRGVAGHLGAWVRNKDFYLLILLNTQWLHLFWITDEFVVTAFNESGTVLPLYLAWIAVAVDYLEVPVMIDTARKLLVALAHREKIML